MTKSKKLGILALVSGILIAVIVLIIIKQMPKDEPFTFEGTPTLVEMDDGYDDFEGWGTSLAWWGHAIGQWENEDTFNTLMDLVFDEEKGLGLNIIRYNIGGGENPNIPNTLRPGGDVPSFQPEEGEWDWGADAGQRKVMLAGMERGVNIAEAFSNSPPYWMTISGTVTGGEDGSENLQAEYFDAFADYLTEVVKHYEEAYEVKFRTLNPLNEPNSDWWAKGGGQEGAYFSIESQMDLIKKVKQLLKDKGLSDTMVSGPDTFSVDETLANLKNYDKETLDILSQINTHAYHGMKQVQLRKEMDKLGKKLWMSEFGAGGSEAHNHKDMTSVMQLAERIIIDLRIMQPDAWIYWQAIEDEGAQNNWGFIHSKFHSDENYVLTKQYYAMANFSKFIRPGSRLILTTDGRTIAAYDKEKEQLSIVVRNEKTESRTIEYDLTDFLYNNRTANIYETTIDKDLEQSEISIYNNGFALELDPESITTIVIDNVKQNMGK